MKKIGVFVLLLVLLTSCVLATSISYPHGFNGNIIAGTGNPNGKVLVGYVNGIATGQTIIQDGKFDIVVLDNFGTGGEIEFYIGNEKAEETFTFNEFDVEQTDLTFEEISQEQNLCGNGICESGECSFCAIDCNVNTCNNSICDIAMGETCSNSPIDCGNCPTNGGSSDGGSTGSSSSGGGSGISPVKRLSDNGSEEENVPLTTQELNENDEKKIEGNFFTSFLTGAVTGVGDFVKSGNGIYAIIGGITLLVLTTAILVSKKKKPVENKVEETNTKVKEEDKNI